MFEDHINAEDFASGIGRLGLLDEKTGKIVTWGAWCKNTILYGWAPIVAKALANQTGYHIGALYLEYENGAAGTPVAEPSFGRADGDSYFDSLALDPNKDYLRVALNSSLVDSTDSVLFPDGNRLSINAQSSGLVGVHGKAFSDAAGSRVYGLAAVATPDFSDATQDIVFNRLYFTGSAQMDKPAGNQVVATYKVAFN